MRQEGSLKSNNLDDRLEKTKLGGEDREDRATIHVDSSSQKKKKKKTQRRKILSMLDIQDRFLLVKEKKKRDQVLKREKGKGILARDEFVVNASLSDSDISNRRKVILGEAKKAWDAGKRLGFSIRENEREVIDELMRLEGL